MDINEQSIQKFKKTASRYAETTFNAFLFGYVILLIFESFIEGFVSFYFNLNMFLWICLASGLILVLLGKKQSNNKEQKITKNSYLTILFFSITTTIIIIFKTSEMGALSYLIGIISGLLVLLLSYVLLSENK